MRQRLRLRFDSRWRDARGIEPGISGLVITRTLIGRRRPVIEIANTRLAGDRTELVYTTDLERWARPGRPDPRLEPRLFDPVC